MSDYESLGVRSVINGAARLTRLGDSLMPVLAAMTEAARSQVDMGELQQAVSRRLAEVTRNDVALVTAGASAGLVNSASFQGCRVPFISR